MDIEFKCTSIDRNKISRILAFTKLIDVFASKQALFLSMSEIADIDKEDHVSIS